MKRHLLPFLLFALCPLVGSAQSSDAAYPEGTWISELPAEEYEKPYFIEVDVKRVTERDEDHDGIVGCGYIIVSDNKTDKTILEGPLTYAGKGLENGMGNGVYFFSVKAKSGQTLKLGVRKTADLDLKFVSLTGALSSHPFLKDVLRLAPLNGTWTPASIEPCTEKELLENLREALNDNDKDRMAYRTRGYGDVRQFIKAHQGLNPSLPKYAKPKGTGAINIRKERSTSAAIVGELPAGQSLLVVDEYDGWCQVWTSDKKYGWVSLSVVTLSNNKGVAATTTAAAQAKPAAAEPQAKPASAQTSAKAAATSQAKSFTLANGKLGPLSIGQTVASLPKSVEGLYDNYKYETFEVENDMEGSWTEEWCHFYKGGKEIFKCFAEGKKLTTFVLMEGSSFIKTNEGFYVGYNARELFNKKRMKWETYYEGTAFGTSGHFIYHVNSDDVQGGVEFPSRATHIKQNAKIVKIVYQ
jgi:SH3-like domain-containing protein